MILSTHQLRPSVDSYPSIVVAEAVNDNTVFTNPYYTNTVPINPFGRSSFRGQISITPQFNNWFDDTVRPSTIINSVGGMMPLKNQSYLTRMQFTICISFTGTGFTHWANHETKDFSTIFADERRHNATSCTCSG